MLSYDSRKFALPQEIGEYANFLRQRYPEQSEGSRRVNLDTATGYDKDHARMGLIRQLVAA